MDLNYSFTAVFEPAEEGGYIAYIEEIPGVNTQGETVEEARENLADAFALMMEVLKEDAQLLQKSKQVQKEQIRMVA